MSEPGRTAIGTWSGGRFMHFGEPIEEERLEALLRPGDGIDTVLTADAYGAGRGRRAARPRARRRRRATTTAWSARSATTSTRASATARRASRASPTRALRGPDDYADYLRMATERSLERLGADRFDLLLLHNPDRTGYTSEAVWDGMAALREAGPGRARSASRPGPANGFTLDLIDCFERFGERIDWAMIILNPFEPWPGELVPRRGGRAPRRQGDHPGRRLRRPLLGRRPARAWSSPRATTAPSGPQGWIEAGLREARADAPDRRARTG